MGKLRFKKLYDEAVLPTRKFSTDAGWDLYSVADVFIPAWTQRVINTGVEFAGLWYEEKYQDGIDGWEQTREVLVDGGFVLQIWSRSGLDSKHALHVGAGVIDAGYRGEILVLIKNLSDVDYTVFKGDKIAQILPVMLYPITEARWAEQETEAYSDRGVEGGIADYIRYGENRVKTFI